ncbi:MULTISPECIES: hypothetical protein [unclassified Virgibacillus]|uniref:hypothetical protein n=1 Tax=unclassified Virgibacillus TaxID=2620237 RepID=UPI0024DE7896|nr:hypothetical protein [Virgibacillus sp. LDC-1]
MYVIPRSRVYEEKMKQLREGHTAYAESPVVIEKIKRGIEKEKLNVHVDYSSTGCYFTPIPASKSS